MVDLEKRAKAWDGFAGGSREFTIGDTFNAAYDAGYRDGAASQWVKVESHDELPKSEDGRVRFLAMFKVGEYRDYDLFQNLLGELYDSDGAPLDYCVKIIAYKLVEPFKENTDE